MHPLTAIIIFLRLPVAGEVKTRLAATIGREKAVEFYQHCAGHIMNEVLKLPNIFTKYIFYSNEKHKNEIVDWCGEAFFYSPQRGKGLGERMANAFYHVFEHGAENAIIIGTDVPDIKAETIIEAREVLDNEDLVIGPSPDGGYYLLGMKKPTYQIFKDIPYSSHNTLEKTIEAAEKSALSLKQIQSLSDIDTEEDLVKWYKECNTSELTFPLRNFLQNYFSK